jgi:RHS repeat-associated protein
VYGLDLISQDQPIVGAWTQSFYGYDGHGSVRYLTNDSGTVTDTYDYDAFGVLITHQGSTPNRYLYAGEAFDSDLGFYYLRARYMNPRTGRFMSMDGWEGGITDPLTLHKYLYGGGNPVNNIDPSGNFTLTEAVVVSALVATSLAITGAFIYQVNGALIGPSTSKAVAIVQDLQTTATHRMRLQLAGYEVFTYSSVHELEDVIKDIAKTRTEPIYELVLFAHGAPRRDGKSARMRVGKGLDLWIGPNQDEITPLFAPLAGKSIIQNASLELRVCGLGQVGNNLGPKLVRMGFDKVILHKGETDVLTPIDYDGTFRDQNGAYTVRGGTVEYDIGDVPTVPVNLSH